MLSSERVKETLSSAKRRNPAKRIENSFQAIQIYFIDSYKCILSGAIKFESVRSAYEGDNFRGPKFYVSFFYEKQPNLGSNYVINTAFG